MRVANASRVRSVHRCRSAGRQPPALAKPGGSHKRLDSVPLSVIAASCAALLGLVLLASTAITSDPVVAEGTEVRVEGISVWLEASEFLAGAHDPNDGADTGGGFPSGDATQLQASNAQGDGFAMPQAMMPGVPEAGFQRLQVDLSFLNRGGIPVQLSPTEFVLENDDGGVWDALIGGTFAAADLSTGQVLNTIVAFDIAETYAEDPLYLVWNRGGTVTRFTISATGGHHG